MFFTAYTLKLIFQLAPISVHYAWFTNTTFKSTCRITHAHYFYILKYIFVTSLRTRVKFYKPLFSFSSLFVCVFFLFACLQMDKGASRGEVQLLKSSNKNYLHSQWRFQGRGPGGHPSPLFVDQTEAQGAVFNETRPHLLSQGLNDRPNPLLPPPPPQPLIWRSGSATDGNHKFQPSCKCDFVKFWDENVDSGIGLTSAENAELECCGRRCLQIPDQYIYKIHDHYTCSRLLKVKVQPC